MTTTQNQQECTALIAHLMAQPWNVFGTLKFINGRTIGRDTAHKLLRRYWNRIDLTFFGKAAERQRVRVPRWCFAHEGSDSENFHIHFALLSPIPDIDHACTILNAVWAQHHPQTAPLDKNWITPVQDRTAVAHYLTREYWRLGDATLLDDISWDQTTADTMGQYHHAQQAQRITRAASPNWLRQAEQALATQQARL
jgi:hypothetical protein